MDGISKYSLGPDVAAAIPQAKNDFRMNLLRKYEGREISDPEAGKRGAQLFEARVGNDRVGGAGVRRLVLLVQSGQITKMFFTENHYNPGSWKRITDF